MHEISRIVSRLEEKKRDNSDPKRKLHLQCLNKLDEELAFRSHLNLEKYLMAPSKQNSPCYLNGPSDTFPTGEESQ